MNRDVLFPSDRGEQPQGSLTLVYEPALALVQFPRSEAEALTTAACDAQRIGCNSECRPPMRGERVEADGLPVDARVMLRVSAPLP